MSGIETIKIIVDAEREAAKILENAESKASEIRNRLDSRVREQHEEMFRTARKEAASLVHDAEVNGKVEAEAYEKETEISVRQVLARASSRKEKAVAKVVETVLELKA